MLKRKIFILIPLVLILGILINTWLQVIGVAGEQFIPAIRHYLALILFVPLVWYFLKDIKRCILYTGIYLLLATFYLIALLPDIVTSSRLGIGSIKLPFPPMSLYSFGVLILYLTLHFDVLTNYYLDHKESKDKKNYKQ